MTLMMSSLVDLSANQHFVQEEDIIHNSDANFHVIA